MIGLIDAAAVAVATATQLLWKKQLNLEPWKNALVADRTDRFVLRLDTWSIELARLHGRFRFQNAEVFP